MRWIFDDAIMVSVSLLVKTKTDRLYFISSTTVRFIYSHNSTTLSGSKLCSVDDRIINDGRVRIGGGNRITQEDPPQCHIYRHKSHMTAWDRTRASAVGSGLLTAWAMSRPCFHLYSTVRHICYLFTSVFFDSVEVYLIICRSQWPHGLRHELSSPAQTLEFWFRIPLDAWMSVCVYPMCR
jgi:hypothetical protein